MTSSASASDEVGSGSLAATYMASADSSAASARSRYLLPSVAFGDRLRHVAERVSRTGADGQIAGVLAVAPESAANRTFCPWRANRPRLQLFRGLVVLALVAYLMIGIETRGRTIEELDAALGRPKPIAARPG
jgi:hypothetical protein